MSSRSKVQTKSTREVLEKQLPHVRLRADSERHVLEASRPDLSCKPMEAIPTESIPKTAAAADARQGQAACRCPVVLGWLRCIYAFFISGTVLICSCTGVYFRTADQPPPQQATVVEWPVREYWTGIVFNGTRIGFTHFTMSPTPGPDRRYDIRSEAYLQTRFLWMDKTIQLVSFDRVSADLTLQRFHYAYTLDGNRMTIEGRVQDNALVYTLQTRGQTEHREMTLPRPLVPTSATGLYPLLRGLRVGDHYRYDVFDGQTQQVGSFDQEVLVREIRLNRNR